MFINNNLLKILYNFMLSGMPNLISNPINKNPLSSAFIVSPYSTYINYKLDNHEYNIINSFMNNNKNNSNSNNFKIIPTEIIKNTNLDYFLSINIYNCTSPLFDFLNNQNSVRCEINTYVCNKQNLKGTLILDYVSNMLSLDPVNLFKKSGNIQFLKKNNIIKGFANNKNFNLKFKYNINNNFIKNNKISYELVKYTDIIYYTSGIYDKVFYDSLFIDNDIITTLKHDVKFKFLDYEFKNENLHSVFYFKNKINFMGVMWSNIFNID